MSDLNQLPPEHLKTYRVLQPLKTHYRKATCFEVKCDLMANGWRSVIDEATDLGQAQAHYIRHEAGRRFSEEKTPNGLTVFTFVPGQKCFNQHVVNLDRPARFLIQDGDSRGNPRGTETVVRTAEDWADDFANHQQKLADKHEEG
jgi:hypothetical protein